MWAHLRLGSLVSIYKACRIKVYSLLSIPPVSLTSAFFSDRYSSRGIVIIIVSMLSVSGLALFLSDLALSLIQMFLC